MSEVQRIFQFPELSTQAQGVLVVAVADRTEGLLKKPTPSKSSSMTSLSSGSKETNPAPAISSSTSLRGAGAMIGCEKEGMKWFD